DTLPNMIRAASAVAYVAANQRLADRGREGVYVLARHYWAHDLGGYYFVADDTDDLIVRPSSGQDEATPNANAVMVSNLAALYLWTGEQRYRARAEAILHAFAGAIGVNVLAHTGLLAAELDLLSPAP